MDKFSYEIKRKRKKELIDKAIEYLEGLKENDDIYDALDISVATDENAHVQDFEVYTSIDIDKIFN